jgi:hypothetical protein
MHCQKSVPPLGPDQTLQQDMLLVACDVLHKADHEPTVALLRAMRYMGGAWYTSFGWAAPRVPSLGSSVTRGLRQGAVPVTHGSQPLSVGLRQGAVPVTHGSQPLSVGLRQRFKQALEACLAPIRFHVASEKQVCFEQHACTLGSACVPL